MTQTLFGQDQLSLELGERLAAQIFQFPCSHPAPFFPTFSVFVCSSHASSLLVFTKSG